MNLIKPGFCLLLAAFGIISPLRAQVPPAEQLLPDDTLALFTIPDWGKVRQAQTQTSWGQLWSDAAMKPFRDNFVSNFQSDFLKPIEKQLGVNLNQYAELLQGQITLAFLPPAEGTSELASVLFLLDAKDKADALKEKLAEARKKWTDSGKEVKTEKIRDLEFSTVSFSKADVQKFLQKAFPASDAEDEKVETTGESDKIQLRIGQFKSLLIVSENNKAIEKVLARQSGGLVQPLAEQVSYQKSHSLLFRDSIAHGWLNFRPVYEKILKMVAQEQPDGAQQPGMPQMRLDKILPALGFGSLETLAGKLSAGSEGSAFEFFAGAPEARREGLLKLFSLEKKEAAPPAFVPADVIKFQRSRIDSQKAWAALENLINKIDPSIASLVQLMLSSAGKDKDPNFDLKKNLIGNLGDDFIQYQKAPKSGAPADLAAPPTLYLLGSPDAPALVDAVRMITSLLPPPLSSAPLKEREFLGRKVYSLSLAAPQQPGDEDAKAPAVQQQSISFTSTGGYVAISADTPILEEYLRSSENPPKPLRAIPGFAEAAQKAGGTDTGYFAYDNQAETTRLALDALKKDPEAYGRSLSFLMARVDEEGQDTFSRFFNLKLLPSYDRIAKYMGFSVVSAGSTSDGFVAKVFAPRPSGLAK